MECNEPVLMLGVTPGKFFIAYYDEDCDYLHRTEISLKLWCLISDAQDGRW
jgi:hypothetical protein